MKHLRFFVFRYFPAGCMYFFKTSILYKNFYQHLLDFLFTSAGVGRTGIFIALSNSIEQINIEHSVNIFQIVNKIREQRPTKILTRVRKFHCIFYLIAA